MRSPLADPPLSWLDYFLLLVAIGFLIPIVAHSVNSIIEAIRLAY